MITYNLILAVSVIAGIPLCRNKAGKIVYCVLAGLLLFFVAALRSRVGYDYNSYAAAYIYSVPETLEEISYDRMEKGYLMITKLLADYVVGFQILFVVIAAVITVPVMIFVYRHCEKPYLAVFGFLTFGVYFNSLCFLRQTVAAVIVMCGLKYIEKGNFFRFAAVVIFASCFHISAVIMFLFYFLLKIKITPTVLSVYAAASAVIFTFSYEIMVFVTRFFYSNYNPASNPHMMNGLTPIYTIFFGAVFIIAFLLRKPLLEKDEFNSILINCMFFTVFFELIGIKHSIVARPSLYFALPASVALIPQIFDAMIQKCSERFKDDKHKQTVSKTAAVMAVMMLCVGMYEYLISEDYNGVMPYRTIFSDEMYESGE
ncbi:MAG: EpsG family protein [Oscillospiraceae bacterium]|nr:EpsG family protein [Oscillospiraceae bacterium]